MSGILGIHHMTALSGPAQENLEFYSGVLGLRLVKLTVNFDDPSAYHLYYGDASGTPGSLLTFFPYPNGYPGRPGSGQATVTSLSVPNGSLHYWVDRFRQEEVDFDRIANRGNTQILPFRAPDGLPLELVCSPEHIPGVGWSGSDVEPDSAIGGMRSVTLVVRELLPTATVLTEILGFRKTDERENRHRYEVADGGIGKTLEIIVDPAGPAGRPGHGSVHHVAFRIADGEEQLEKRNEVIQRHLGVTPVMDRDYFRSIYFREPGGILFEIATDGPGFAVDEPPEALGTSLRLPAKFESRRGQIEKALPTLELPHLV